MKKLYCLLAVLIFSLVVHVNAFADSVILPESLNDIEEEAFFHDMSITDVIIREGAQVIGPRAFAGSGLKSIHIPTTVNQIDSTAFDDLSETFTIYAPKGSYAHLFAVNNHYHWIDSTDLKASYTIESDIGDCFIVDSVIDAGERIEVRCRVSAEYSADENTLFSVCYGVEGNCILHDALSLDALKRGMTYSFLKSTISQHDIPPVISLHLDGPNLKDSYTIESDIGDYFVVDTITQRGNTIDVSCHISPEYTADPNTLFSISYGVEGNNVYKDGYSLADLQDGRILSYSKSTIDQHNIPPIITLHTEGIDLKDSYTIESDIGDYFVVKSIIDIGDRIEVKCYISKEYTAGSNQLFNVSYGREGNCMNQSGVTLEALQRGMRCGFSKKTISQYNILSIISLHVMS